MPQNRRTFLCQLNLLLISLHLYLLFTHSIFLFFLSLALCQLNPPLFHLSPALSSVCVNPLPLAPSPPHLIHHYSSRLHLVHSLLLSTCFHFLNCSYSIIFTLPSMVIFHFLSFIHSYLVLSGFTSLLSFLFSMVGFISPKSQSPRWAEPSLSRLLSGWMQCEANVTFPHDEVG